MTTMPPLHQSYAAAVPELSAPWRAEAMPRPRLLLLHEELAAELGLDAALLRSSEGIRLLTGASDLPTTAQAYGGHQFGAPNPQLGDGRALLLGDLVDVAGRRRDLHLKGSGRTPFSRAGDGRAPLGPMLRELVIGEALHANGVPSTRALAVLVTGERIRRQAAEPEQGAILVRVAASHLRVGTVQHAAWTQEPEVLAALVRYAIGRHHPSAAEAPVPALGLLEAVMTAQAELVARWMLLGFVHGVMNTDNMTLSGESIDFGPCAFLDAHDPGAVFSSIDRGGRYAYRNQPGIALWNLGRFAEALLPLIDERPDAAVDAATEVLERFEGEYRRAWASGMRAKLGIPEGAGADAEVIDLGADLLDLLAAERVDHTGFFRALAEGRAAAMLDRPAPVDVAAGLGLRAAEDPEADPPAGSRPGAACAGRLASWERRRRALAGVPATPGRSDAERASLALMARTNPVYIPRNHALDAALQAAEDGDLGPVRRLLDAVRSPAARRPGLEDLELPAPDASPFITFCGT
ncbi:protein adenylyltransferase SelO [Brachybacterium hainanense]|uniref:Protein nucleotidyltransferase YdiU n=1 Tax=Brachybacterium hainanense TaxID=1541174 RepID=A0ABV6R8U1_9MICO